jgi:hypothetical protein
MALETSLNTQESNVTGFDDPLLDRARKQIESRKGGYGGRENSFEFIARRFVVWMKNNFDIDVPLDGHHIALLMVEFKLGRAEARRAVGIQHPDDLEDAAAYMQWGDVLDPLATEEMPFEDVDTVDDVLIDMD